MIRPDELALCAVNDSRFYYRFAAPLAVRHALIRATVGPDAWADDMAGDYDYLAVRAVAIWNDLRKGFEGEYALRDRLDMSAIAANLRDHYATGHDPQTAPIGGDLCRSVPAWSWGSFGVKDGALAVMGGAASFFEGNADNPPRFAGPEGASVTYNASALLGNHGIASFAPEYCSCSGGPATIGTDYAGAKFTGEIVRATFWRWRDYSGAGRGETFHQVRPVWALDLNA